MMSNDYWTIRHEVEVEYFQEPTREEVHVMMFVYKCVQRSVLSLLVRASQTKHRLYCGCARNYCCVLAASSGRFLRSCYNQPIMSHRQAELCL